MIMSLVDQACDQEKAILITIVWKLYMVELYRTELWIHGKTQRLLEKLTNKIAISGKVRALESYSKTRFNIQGYKTNLP